MFIYFFTKKYYSTRSKVRVKELVTIKTTFLFTIQIQKSIIHRSNNCPFTIHFCPLFTFWSPELYFFLIISFQALLSKSRVDS